MCTLVGGAILTLALALPHSFCELAAGPMLAAFIDKIVSNTAAGLAHATVNRFDDPTLRR